LIQRERERKRERETRRTVNTLCNGETTGKKWKKRSIYKVGRGGGGQLRREKDYLKQRKNKF